MRIESGRRSRAGLGLTPTIDVVFLLLLFFMLASTFSRFSHVEVSLGGGAASKPSDQTTPIILLSVEDGGAYSVNGEAVSLSEIQTALARVAPDGEARIIIRPAGAALAEHIIPAIEQSKAVRLGPVIIAR